jgi:hypothetical protein
MCQTGAAGRRVTSSTTNSASITPMAGIWLLVSGTQP